MTTASPARRSCTSCPSLLKPADQPAVLGANIGGSVCGLKLIAIGRPDITDSRAPEMTAEKCNDFGKPKPEYDPEKRTAPVVLEVAFAEPPSVPVEQERVFTCQTCSNYVPQPIVSAQSGWNAAYCKAKGVLLMPDRLGKYATSCTDRSFTSTPMSPFTTGRSFNITFLPEYMEGFGRVNPLAAAHAMRAVDPREFTSRYPLSPVAIERGVRAWRSIEDPSGYGPPVKLPVFDYSRYNIENERDRIEQSKIPITGDEEAPEKYIDHGGFVYTLAAGWKMDDTPALWGEAGVGKTELFRHLAWLMVLPFERISITNSSTLDDLAGKTEYTPERGTFFTYGRIPEAWQKACVICLDEPNTGPLEVWQFIRPLTDNSKQLVVDMNHGERLKRNLACYFGLAMNPAWDMRNVGANTLADADGSRLFHVEIRLPPPDVERAILLDNLMADGWEKPQADTSIQLMMKCAADIRALSADGTLPISWGMRSQIKVARALKYFKPVDAFRRGAVDALEPTVRALVLDVVNSYTP